MCLFVYVSVVIDLFVHFIHAHACVCLYCVYLIDMIPDGIFRPGY